MATVSLFDDSYVDIEASTEFPLEASWTLPLPGRKTVRLTDVDYTMQFYTWLLAKNFEDWSMYLTVVNNISFLANYICNIVNISFHIR